jgi:hypothetical protein
MIHEKYLEENDSKSKKIAQMIVILINLLILKFKHLGRRIYKCVFCRIQLYFRIRIVGKHPRISHDNISALSNKNRGGRYVSMWMINFFQK